MENKNYAIESNDLSIHYGTFTAVKGVSLKIERQKINLQKTQRPPLRRYELKALRLIFGDSGLQMRKL